MPVIEDITEEEEEAPKTENLEDRPPEGAKNDNKFPIDDEAEVESDSEDFFDASDLTTVQQWQFISVRPPQTRDGPWKSGPRLKMTTKLKNPPDYCRRKS